MLRGIIFLTAVGLLACGPANDKKEEKDPKKDTNASIVITGPGTLECVGSACMPAATNVTVDFTTTLEHSVASATLYRSHDDLELAASDGGSMTFDVSSFPSGPVSIYVEVTDEHDFTYRSDDKKLMVINDPTGVIAVFLEGTSFAQIDIPTNYNGTQEVDSKLHWTNPAGIKNVSAVVTWEVPAGQEPWNIEVKVGAGNCPHSGTVWGDDTTTTENPLLHEVGATQISATSFPEGRSFVHMRPINAHEHIGESLPYRVLVYLTK